MGFSIDRRLALSVAAGLLLAVAVLALVWVFVQLRDVLVLVFVSVLVAATLSRPIAWLERHRVPSAVAVLLVFLAVCILVAAVLLLVVPPLVSQVLGLRDTIPSLASRLARLRAGWTDFQAAYPELAAVRPQLETVIEQWLLAFAGGLLALPQRIVSALLDFVAILALSTTLILQRRSLFAIVLAVTPPTQQALVRDVVDEVWRRLGSYIGAKLTVMAIVGSATVLVVWPLGVPSPLLLGLLVALGELIPRIGPWLARIPLFALAAGAGSIPLLITIVGSVLIQNLKGLLIAPLVEGERLDVHPLLALLAVLAGVELVGFAGAVLALPAVAALDVLWDKLVRPRWVRASRVVPRSDREQACERTVVRLEAGEPE